MATMPDGQTKAVAEMAATLLGAFGVALLDAGIDRRGAGCEKAGWTITDRKVARTVTGNKVGLSMFVEIEVPGAG